MLPVGQEDYLAELREDLLATVDGDGRVVVIGGEAGIGKTTLVRQFAREAAEQGMQVLTGACYDLPNAPAYGPWLDVFGGVSRGDGLPEPPEAFSGGELRRITDQAALFGDVRGYLAELNQLRPVLLILEDLHWADPSSLDLLRDVARRANTMRVMIVGTYRTDDLTRKHPLYHSLPAIAREAEARRIELRPLNREGLRELVAAWVDLSRSDSDRLVAYLERHAEGNPFFATELIRALKEKGLVALSGERWELAKLDRVVVPPLLQQVIELRVSRLGDATRTVLAIAAVIGQDVPLSLWSAVAGLEKAELFDTVDQAIDAHILEADDAGTVVRFVHALTRDALYDSIMPFRRSAWHSQVADALLATQRPDPDAVAHHLQMAGDSRAWEWLVKAGTRAQDAYAWITAIDRYRSAVELLLADEMSDPRTTGVLLCRLAFIQRFSDPAGAIAAVERARRLPGWDADPIMEGEAHFLLGGLLCFSNQMRDGIAQVTAGLKLLEALPREAQVPKFTAQRLIDGDIVASFLPKTILEDGRDNESERTRLQDVVDSLRHLGEWHSIISGGFSAGLAFMEHVLREVRDAGNGTEGFAVSAAWVYFSLGMANCSLGRPVEAQEAFAESQRRYQAFSHHALEAKSLLTESADRASTYGAAEPELRRKLAAEGESALRRAKGALRSGLSPRIAWLRCMILDGRWLEADEILADTPDPGNAFFGRDVRYANALLARYRGNLRAAWEEIYPLFPDGPDTEPGDVICMEGLELLRLGADLCIDAGDGTGARRWLTAHDTWLTWSGAVLGIAAAEMGWGRLAFAEGDDAEARSRAARALKAATDPDQPVIQISAHRLMGEIALRDFRFQDAERHLRVALGLATVCQMPYEMALGMLTLAECSLRTSRREDAAALVEEASVCFARLDAASALKQANELAARSSRLASAAPKLSILTNRELDVLQLIVAGFTNQSIADELFISRETARTHVSNIFRKLGVDSRAEAVDAAHRRNLVRLEGP